MTTTRISLSAEARLSVATTLAKSLAEAVDLERQAKQAHWNLVGSHFRALHLQLDEVTQLARTHMDTIAERAVALGISPDGRSATVSRSTKLPQPESGWIEDGKVAATMTDILDGISKRMYERIRVTEEADPVSQDLLIAVTQELDKQHWMFQAQR